MLRILVVDDEEMIQRLLKRFLEDKGHEVCVASTGKEALEMIKEAPEIVLLDIMLPDMDGLELLNKAKEISPSTRIILMSGMDGESDHLTSFKGDYVFIAKPMNLKALEQIINA